jgi:hypothetical protein
MGFENKAPDPFDIATYSCDGSRMRISTTSVYWLTFGEFASPSTWFWVGAGRNMSTGDIDGYDGEPFGDYNYQRNWAPTITSVADWEISVKVAWDNVPLCLYRNGIGFSEPFGGAGGFARRPPVAHSVQWAAEMDTDAQCWGRLRFMFFGDSNDYPYFDPTPTADALLTDEFSIVLDEVAVTYVPDEATNVNLKMRRNGYRIRAKIWVDGDDEPDWQVDTYMPKGQEEDFPGTGIDYLDYPWLPDPGWDSTVPILTNDMSLPVMFSWVDTLDAFYWSDPGPNDGDHVGWLQNVNNPLTAWFDDFKIEYWNYEDPVDTNVRCYDFFTEEPITETCVLPKGAQYIGYVGEFPVQAYQEDEDTGFSTEGFPFRIKAWNDPGAPPLQMTRLQVVSASIAIIKEISLTRVRFAASSLDEEDV